MSSGDVESNDSLDGRYSISDLSRLLQISSASLRRWTRLGLIQPVETIHQFAYFSFAEVASARRLSELVAAGASPTRIKQNLEQFRTWLPDGEVSFRQLSLVERSGRVLLRLNNRLVEPNGQRHFDFDADDDITPSISFPTGEAPQFDALFDQGLWLEDHGRFADAVDVYRQAGDLSPDDPAVHFNLGNCLYELGKYNESLASFRHALRCDPQYAEAWNNLGNVLWQTGAFSSALQAFGKALALVPDYSDARRNLESLRNKLATTSFRIVS